MKYKKLEFNDMSFCVVAYELPVELLRKTLTRMILSEICCKEGLFRHLILACR